MSEHVCLKTQLWSIVRAETERREMFTWQLWRGRGNLAKVSSIGRNHTQNSQWSKEAVLHHSANGNTLAPCFRWITSVCLQNWAVLQEKHTKRKKKRKPVVIWSHPTSVASFPPQPIGTSATYLNGKDHRELLFRVLWHGGFDCSLVNELII